jgi:hypothetical protein
MWTLSIKEFSIGKTELTTYYNISFIPRVDEYISIKGVNYKVISILYDYDVKFISVLVKKCE